MNIIKFTKKTAEPSRGYWDQRTGNIYRYVDRDNPQNEINDYYIMGCVSVGGRLAYAAIGLKDGNRFRDPRSTIEEACNGSVGYLEFVGDAIIDVKAC